MTRALPALLSAAALVAASCSSQSDPPPSGNSATAGQSPSGAESGSSGAPGEWQILSSGEGDALIVGDEARPIVRLYCEAGSKQLLVNVPAFDPIGSEERLSLGSGPTVVALVADPSGDSQRGGVSGVGPVPDELGQILSGRIGVSYGAQSVSPSDAPPPHLARDFVSACTDGSSSEGDDSAPPEPEPEPGGPVSACLRQGDATLPANRLRGIGTEPFWSVRIEGRCVTYSTPENQDGTRIWTSFSGSRDRGEWTGFYQDQRFVLRTAPQGGCSDGMSDRRYPTAMTIRIGGDTRRGCAAPPDSPAWNNER